MNKNNLVSGNTVLAPQHEPFEKEYKELKSYKKETNEINRQKRIQNKVKTMFLIAILFAFGFSLIYRYSILYSMEKKLDSLNSQISAVKIENEDLNIKLLSHSNIQNLEDNAAKLNMVSPSKSSIVYCDLSKNNFTKTNENNNKTHQNIIDKIKNILFLF